MLIISVMRCRHVRCYANFYIDKFYFLDVYYYSFACVFRRKKFRIVTAVISVKADRCHIILSFECESILKFNLLMF